MRSIGLQLSLSILLPLLVGAWGCDGDEPSTPAADDAGTLCAGQQDCPATHECRAGRCEPRAAVDLGPRPDSSPEDAGVDASRRPDVANPDSGPGADVSDAGPQGCQPPCTGQQRCDPSTGVCLEANPCLGDEDCHPGRICLDELCTDRCHVESCGVGRVCDPGLGRCVAPPYCLADGTCADAGFACVAGRCYPPCEEGGCPSARMECDAFEHQCQEPAGCLDDGDCLGRRICLQGSCGLPPERCLDHDDCPGDWVCGPSGHCEPPAGCRSDDQCAPLFCDAASGRCEVCVEHVHCPGNQHCQADGQLERNLCQEPEFCVDDTDCLGLRACLEGRCQAPPDCVDDALAGNSSFGEAAPIEAGRHPDLVRCDRLDDWFGVALLAGQGLVATASFEPEIDLSLALFSPDDPFVPLRLSDGAHGTEQVRLGAAAQDGTFGLRVSGRAGQQGSYSLEVQVEEGFCAPDRLEAGVGNDRPEHAVPVALGEQELLGLSLCPGDADWFALPVQRPTDARWVVSAPVGELELQLFAADAPDEPLAAGRLAEEGHFVLEAELAAAPHLLRVAAAVGPLGVAYDLRSTLRTSAAHLQERCTEGPALEFSVPLAGDTTGQPPDFLPSCAAPGHSAPEALYTLHLDAPGAVRVRVLDHDFDAVVSLRGECLDVATELACAHRPPLLYVPELAAGDYTVFVDGYGAGAGPFELLAERDVAGRLPGDSCAEPLPVALSVGSVVELQGDTAPADPALAPRRCGDLADTRAGRDLVYRLDVAEALTLSGAALAEGWQPLLALYGADCGQGEQICALDGRIEGERLAAGTYHLVVDGRDRLGSGPFALTLSASAPELPPGNDTCATAEPLAAGAALPVVLRRAGSTALASVDHVTACGLGEPAEGGPDVLYVLHLAEPTALSVRVEAAFRSVLRLSHAPCGVGEIVACRSGGSLDAGVVPAGDYFLSLHGWGPDDSGPFELDVALAEPPSPCADRAELVDGQVFEASTAQAPNGTSGSCGGAGPDRAHRLVLDDAAQVRVTLAADFAAPVVYLRRTCDDPATELHCVAGAAPLVVPNLPAGDYTLFVDSQDAAGGRYLLSVRRSEASAAPANDRCGDAEDLGQPPADPPLSVQGSTLHAHGDVGSECGELGDPRLGPDVFYRFELAERALLTATLQAEFDALVTVRDEACDAGRELDCADVASGDSGQLGVRLDAGSYLLVISGLDAQAAGAFELTLSATPEGDLPHSCDAPPPIAPATPLRLDNAGGIDTVRPTCAPDGGVGVPESVVRFRLDEPRSVRLRVLDTIRAGTLSLRSDCWQADTELTCTPERVLEVGSLPPGNYVVVADGFVGWPGEPAPLSLLLETGPPDGAPPGDTCASAVPVSLDVPASVELTGTPAGLSDTLPAGCAPAGSPERIWRVEVPAPCVLDASLEAPFPAQLALAAGACGAGQELACGGALAGVRVSAGIHTLSLQAAPAAEGPYSLTLGTRPLPANDGCDAPEVLEFVEDEAEVAGSLELAAGAAAASGCGLGAVTEGSPELVYEVRLPVPARLVAQAAGAGAPALYLRGPQCVGGAELACGAGTLETQGVLPAGTYFLFVDAAGAPPGPFALSVRRVPQEPPANDTCNVPILLAVPAGGGLVEAAGTLAGARPHYVPQAGLCPDAAGRGPDVVYAFDLQEPMALRATVQAQYAAVVYLSEPCGAALESACAASDGWLRTAPLPVGRHYLVVDGPTELGGTPGFLLQAELTPLPANDDCDGAIPLSVDAQGVATVSGDTRAALSRFASPACGGTGAPDLVYSLELEEPSDVLFDMTADFGSVIHVQGELCGDAAVSCFTPPQLLQALPAGTYHVAVDGATPGAAGVFTLSAQVRPALARALDDKCFEAPTLELSGGEAVVVGHSGGADALLESEACPGETAASSERVFRLDLQHPALLSVDVLEAQRPVVVSLLAPDRLPPRAACSQHDELACGAAPQPIRELPLQPEEYFLVVDGASAQGPGAFRLRVRLGATADEKCQAAPWLLPSPQGVVFAGTTVGASSVLAPAGCGADAAAAASPEAAIRFAFDERMALTATTVAAEAPLAVSVRALPCGQAHELGCGVTTVGQQVLDRLVLEPGEYALIVDAAAAGGGGAFELLLAATPYRLPEEKCADAPGVVLGPQRPWLEMSGDTAEEDALFAPQQCAPAADPAAPESLYRLVVEAEGLLSVDVLDSEQDAAVSLRGLAGDLPCDAAPELACGVGASPIAQLPVPAGELLLAVDGAGAVGPGAFALGLRWEPTPEAKCAAAEPLILDAGELLVEGNSTGSSGVLSPSTCGAPADGVAPELVYDLWLREPRLVSLVLQRSDNPAVVYLRAPCAGGQEQLCAWDGQSAEAQFLPAGHYGLVVDGHDGQPAGSFTVLLRAEAQGDTCDAPLELWGGAGSLRIPGSTGGARDDLQTQGCGFDTAGPDTVFLLDLPVRSDVDLGLHATPGFPEPSLYVLQDCAAPAAPLACATPARPAALRALEPGAYYVVVDSAAAPTEYELDVRVSDLPAACVEAGRLPVRVPIDGVTDGEGDSVIGSCAMPGASPDRLYRLVLDQAASVSLSVESEDFEPVLIVLDDCSLDATELGCRTGSGTLSWQRLEAGEYIVAVDGQQGGHGRFALTLSTGAPAQPGGGQGCDGAQLLDPVAAGGVLDAFGTVHGHGDSFGFCETPAAPDAAYALELPRPMDLRVGLRPYADQASLTLIPAACHDGRAAAPWAPELGEPLLCQEVPAGPFALTRELERVPAGRYTLVVDGAVAAADFDFDLHVEALEQSTLYAPVLTPGLPHVGTLVGKPDRFSEDCGLGAAPSAPDAVHRVSVPAGQATLRLAVTHSTFTPSLAVYSHPLREAPMRACAVEASLDHEQVWTGSYAYVVVGSVDGLAGEYTLEVAIERPE